MHDEYLKVSIIMVTVITLFLTHHFFVCLFVLQHKKNMKNGTVRHVLNLGS